MEQHTVMGVWLQGAACFRWFTHAGQPGLAIESLACKFTDHGGVGCTVWIVHTRGGSHQGKISRSRQETAYRICVAFAVRARLVSQLNSKSILQCCFSLSFKAPGRQGWSNLIQCLNVECIDARRSTCCAYLTWGLSCHCPRPFAVLSQNAFCLDQEGRWSRSRDPLQP